MSIFKLNLKGGIRALKNDSEFQSPYYKLKDEYNKFIQNASNSDLANSKTLLENQLSMLLKLQDLADSEGLKNEVQDIKKQIVSVSSSLEAFRQDTMPSAYYPPVIHLENKSDSDNQINLYIDYLKENDYQVSEDKINVAKLLINSDFSENYIKQILYEISNSKENIDYNYYSNACNFKSKGLDDLSCLKFSKFLNLGFEDENSVKASILNLYKAGINSDSALKILNNLIIKSPDSSLFRINSSAVQTICRMKKTLYLTRDNEKNERNNPINTQNIQVFNSGDTVIIYKDNKISYISPLEGKSVSELEEKYDDVISKIEDNILCDFSEKYTKEGKFNNIYPRTFVALRRMGICYDQLINLTDMAVNSSEAVDKNFIDVISSFKQAGMLSADIPSVILASKKNEDGNFDNQDVKNSIELTNALISGNIIAKFLPYIHDNENLKNLILDLSYSFKNKTFVSDIIDKTITKDNAVDENAIDTIFSLSDYLSDSKKTLSEKQFCNTLIYILNEAKNPSDDKISDDAAGIISILIKNLITPDDILSLLKLSKTKNNVVDSQLADIIWNLSLNKVNTDVIVKVIEKCKKDGDINYSLVNTILSFFESKEPVSKIIDAVIG